MTWTSSDSRYELSGSVATMFTVFGIVWLVGGAVLILETGNHYLANLGVARMFKWASVGSN